MAIQKPICGSYAAIETFSVAVRQLRKYFEATRIDEVLLEHRGEGLQPAPTSDLPFTITKYTRSSPSGSPSIDRKLYSHWCFVAKIEDKTVHRAFVSFGTPLPGQFGFDRRAPVIGECYTTPHYRGHGLQAVVMHQIVADVLQNTNRNRVYTLVSPDNVASLRGVTKAGFTPVARMTALRCLGFLFSRRIDREFSVDLGTR
jgi:RimJ/RimL family protein N-acetyltransferase